MKMLRKLLPVLLIILSVAFGLYRDYYMPTTPVIEEVEPVVETVAQPEKETVILTVSKDVNYIELDAIDSNKKYVDQNNNEVFFVSNIMKDENNHDYVMVKYLSEGKNWRADRKFLGKVEEVETVEAETNNSQTSNTKPASNTKPVSNTKPATQTATNSGSSNANTPSNQGASNSNNNPVETKPQTPTNTGSNNNNSNNNSNNSGSNNNSNQPSQPTCTWVDKQVLVTPGHYETITTGNAWDEWIETKPAWDETIEVCNRFGSTMVEVQVCAQCGAQFATRGEAGDHLTSAGHINYYNDFIPIDEPHCLEWGTSTQHHNAEGYIQHHEATTTQIWIDPVYRTERVCE